MTALEALQSVQYVTVNGRRVAVIDVEEWEALIECLEDAEDLQLAKQARAELETAGGNRERAGWRKWSEVAEEIE